VTCTRRFQDGLLKEARRANKIDAAYRIPEEFRNNTPERLAEAFATPRRAGLFSEYPFGTDLTREEIDLARALRWLKERTGSKAGRVATIARALFRTPDEAHRGYLDRLNLAARNFDESLTARLVSLALTRTRSEREAVTSRTAATDP